MKRTLVFSLSMVLAFGSALPEIALAASSTQSEKKKKDRKPAWSGQSRKAAEWRTVTIPGAQEVPESSSFACLTIECGKAADLSDFGGKSKAPVYVWRVTPGDAAKNQEFLEGKSIDPKNNGVHFHAEATKKQYQLIKKADGTVYAHPVKGGDDIKLDSSNFKPPMDSVYNMIVTLDGDAPTSGKSDSSSSGSSHQRRPRSGQPEQPGSPKKARPSKAAATSPATTDPKAGASSDGTSAAAPQGPATTAPDSSAAITPAPKSTSKGGSKQGSASTSSAGQAGSVGQPSAATQNDMDGITGGSSGSNCVKASPPKANEKGVPGDKRPTINLDPMRGAAASAEKQMGPVIASQWSKDIENSVAGAIAAYDGKGAGIPAPAPCRENPGSTPPATTPTTPQNPGNPNTDKPDTDKPGTGTQRRPPVQEEETKVPTPDTSKGESTLGKAWKGAKEWFSGITSTKGKKESTLATFFKGALTGLAYGTLIGLPLHIITGGVTLPLAMVAGSLFFGFAAVFN